jgi:uroporphyrinogen-III synthase
VSFLSGTRVVNTRPAHQAADLDAVLRARGAESISFPCIAIAEPQNSAALDAAVAALLAGAYGWIVFASASAVAAVAARIGDRLIPSGVKVAAVGNGSASAARDLLRVESIFVPDQRHESSGLVSTIPVRCGERVLVPASSIARPELDDGLRAAGAQVEAVVAYRTVEGRGGADLAPLLANRSIDAIAFASPSAVTGFVARVAALGFGVPDIAELPVGCIGATTADRAETCGFASIAIAPEPTVDRLADALESALSMTHKGVAR